MSYPIHKVSGGSAARTVRTENGFWGLELAESALNRAFSRAVDTENLLWEGEALRVRPGYQLFAALEGRINGIFHYKGYLVVHAGNSLYRLIDGQEPEKLEATLDDQPSFGVVRYQTAVRRRCTDPTLCQWERETLTGDLLFISTGYNFVFYDGTAVRSVADDCWGIGVSSLIEAGSYQSYFATVPFTAVAKDPLTGVGDVDPRGDNRLSQFRCESFYVGGTAVSSFPLNCGASVYNTDTPAEVQLRDSTGTWRCLCSSSIAPTFSAGATKLTTPSLQAGMAMTGSGATVTQLGSGTLTLANDGMDNVRITYGVLKEEPLALIRAKAQGLYGADGADNVLFLGGSDQAPGEDAFSARDDFFCFYETSVEHLGSSITPVTGYCRLSDGRLAVLKNDPDGGAVFFRSHTTVSLGTTQSGEPYQVDAFPSVAGAAVEGCVSPQSVGFAGNEPCFLAASGLYSVRSVSNELTNLNETVRRSGAVDPLIKTLAAEDARSIRWQGYYLITFGPIALITDGKRDSNGSLRFLKWRFAHGVTALGQREDRLYFGDENGNLYLFGEGTDDAGTAFSAWWQTPLLEESNGHRMILRRMWAAVSPGYGASVSAVLYRDNCPMTQRELALHLADFGDWDFGNVTFDGSDTVRWIPLNRRSAAADAFSVRLELSAAADLRLWGFRMTYEKGGMMR